MLAMTRNWLITSQEVQDEAHVKSQAVLTSVKLVNDYFGAEKEGTPFHIPDAHMKPHFFVYRNFSEAARRLSAIYDQRTAVLNELADEHTARAKKARLAAVREVEISLAVMEGAERERKRARGEAVPEEPPQPQQVADFEVESSADGEGVKRRKTMLEQRKNNGRTHDLPSATLFEKDKLREQAVAQKRAKRAKQLLRAQ